MRRHNRTLFRAARAILRDDAEAEDALQEAYMHAYRSIGAFRGDSKLSTWLARIVANEALMRLRKRARRAEISDPFHVGSRLKSIEPLPSPDKGPESSAQRARDEEAAREAHRRAARGLPAVFMLRAVEEFRSRRPPSCCRSRRRRCARASSAPAACCARRSRRRSTSPTRRLRFRGRALRPHRRARHGAHRHPSGLADRHVTCADDGRHNPVGGSHA